MGEVFHSDPAKTEAVMRLGHVLNPSSDKGHRSSFWRPFHFTKGRGDCYRPLRSVRSFDGAGGCALGINTSATQLVSDPADFLFEERNI